MVHNGPGCYSKISARKFALQCKVVSCTNRKITPPPLFQVDTTGTCWADKVAQEEMGAGGRWGDGGEGGEVGCWGAGKCKFPFTPPPSHFPLPSPTQPSSAGPMARNYPHLCAHLSLPRPPHSPLIGRYLPKLARRETERADFELLRRNIATTLMIIVSDSKLDWRSSTGFD